MKPDVQVTVEGGIARVLIHRPGLVVEVRDYDVDCVVNEGDLWTDEEGNRCVRYFETGDDEVR